jgi:type II secretory pathway pseudopilin PulG
MTLVELMVALAIFSVLLTTTLAFYRQQGKAFTESNDRMAVMQNLRYAVNDIEQGVRTAGVGVPAKQPVIVYADSDVIAFNADYATNQPNDFFAVFYDPRVPDAAMSAVDPSRAFAVPTSSFVYPDSAYYSGSGNSPAETIVFYFAPDVSTPRSDDYALFRQVNGLEPDLVARRLLRTDRPFFSYYRTTVGGGTLVQLDPTELPVAQTVPIHGSVADTGVVALADSILAVRASYSAASGLAGADQRTRTISRLIRLPNAGLAAQPNCGNRPLLGSGLQATAVDATASASGYIRLQWDRAVDEYIGEQDVIRYVLWRREGNSGPWGDPLISVSPGSSTYVHEDHTAVLGVGYTYALAAQDCTPSYSALSASEEVWWEGL